MDTAAAVRRWIDEWLQAWPAADVDGVAALYKEDAPYRSHPFRDAETARAYAARAFQEEELVEARFGGPIVEDDRAAVEYWAILRSPDGKELTLAGMVNLRFAPDGRVAEHREYWDMQEGRREPPPGWGD